MKIDALPRPFGAAALSLLAIALLALALPALGFAAEDEGGEPPPIAPELSFSPAPLDFGKATVGTESTAVYVSVHNAGSVVATIDKITVEGPDAGDFKFSGSNCGWLAPGQDCSGWISFAPGSVGPKAAALVAQLKEFPAQSAPLSGTGVPTQLSFSPSTYDFGVRRVYDNTGVDLELTNSGEAPVQLGNLDIVGPDSNSFSTGPSSCWGYWIQPGASCYVSVGFNPNHIGPLAAAVRATAHGQSFTAALSGTGGQAIVAADTDPAEFGAATVGMAGATRTLVLTNTGNLSANYFIGIVSGGDAGSFRLLSENCSGAPIEPEASCSARVRFAPDSAGPKQAKLSFFGDAEGGTQVTLSGEGVAATATLAPAGFDFGAQAAGTKSAPRAFVFSNDGDAPLRLDRVAIAGLDLDQFAVAGDECSDATLAPGDACEVRVRFTPDSPGAKAAKLRVSGADAAFTAALSGTTAPAGGSPTETGGTSPASASAAEPRQPGRHRARNRFRRGKSLGATPLHDGLVAPRRAAPRG